MSNLETIFVEYATTENLDCFFEEQAPLICKSKVNSKLTVDNIDVNVGDLLLVKDQTTQKENGIYKVLDVGSLTTRFRIERYIPSVYFTVGFLVFVKAGTDNIKTLWMMMTPDKILTYDVSPIQFIGVFNDYSDDTLSGIGTIGNPLSVNVSIDSDNILSYGSDGALSAKVNNTNTNRIVSKTITDYIEDPVDVDITFNLRGQIVTISIPSFTVIPTVNISDIVITDAIPLLMRPPEELIKYATVEDQLILKNGLVTLSSNGNIIVHNIDDINTYSSKTFTPGEPAGLKYFTASWVLES